MNEIETKFSETLNEVLERGFVIIQDHKCEIEKYEDWYVIIYGKNNLYLKIEAQPREPYFSGYVPDFAIFASAVLPNTDKFFNVVSIFVNFYVCNFCLLFGLARCSCAPAFGLALVFIYNKKLRFLVLFRLKIHLPTYLLTIPLYISFCLSIIY